MFIFVSFSSALLFLCGCGCPQSSVRAETEIKRNLSRILNNKKIETVKKDLTLKKVLGEPDEDFYNNAPIFCSMSQVNNMYFILFFSLKPQYSENAKLKNPTFW